MNIEDGTLLRQFVATRSEPAFAALVERYVTLVYNAALRRTGGDAQNAADVAQTVFIALARNARALQRHPTLSGWLHTATKNAALNLMKSEQRRRRREASAMNDMTAAESPPAWHRVGPLLDSAIDELSESDRTAIVLRFLEKRSYGAVATALRVSEDAARVRTNRALDKLREQLNRRGVTSTAGALSLLLADHAVAAVPPALTSSLITTAVATAPAGAATLVTFLLMNKTIAPLLAAGLACVATTFVWNATVRGATSADVAALRDENAKLTAATKAGPSSDAAAAVVNELDHDASQIAAKLQRQQASVAAKTAAPGSKVAHRNHGCATAMDAQLTSAWAMDSAEIAALAEMLVFDGNGRQQALEVLASVPPTLREQYSTPEALYAFFLAAETQLGRPPAEDLLLRMVPLQAEHGWVRFGRPGNTTPVTMPYQQTASGWKLVIEEPLVPLVARTVLSKEFFAQFEGGKP